MTEKVTSRRAVAPIPLYSPKMPFCLTRSTASRVADIRFAATTVPFAVTTGAAKREKSLFTRQYDNIYGIKVLDEEIPNSHVNVTIFMEL